MSSNISPRQAHGIISSEKIHKPLDKISRKLINQGLKGSKSRHIEKFVSNQNTRTGTVSNDTSG